jgi:hypothetical protein
MTINDNVVKPSQRGNHKQQDKGLESTDEDFCVIQWNCNGFCNKFEGLKILIANENSVLLCLQETHIQFDQIPSLRNFDMFQKTTPFSSIHSEEIVLQTDLKAVAAPIA